MSQDYGTSFGDNEPRPKYENKANFGNNASNKQARMGGIDSNQAQQTYATGVNMIANLAPAPRVVSLATIIEDGYRVLDRARSSADQAEGAASILAGFSAPAVPCCEVQTGDGNLKSTIEHLSIVFKNIGAELDRLGHAHDRIGRAIG